MHHIERTRLAHKIINPHLLPPEKRVWGGECYQKECPFHEYHNNGPDAGPFCDGFPADSTEALCRIGKHQDAEEE